MGDKLNEMVQYHTISHKYYISRIRKGQPAPRHKKRDAIKDQIVELILDERPARVVNCDVSALEHRRRSKGFIKTLPKKRAYDALFHINHEIDQAWKIVFQEGLQPAEESYRSIPSSLGDARILDRKRL